MRGRLVLLTAVVALWGAGCGDDDGGTDRPDRQAQREHARLVRFHRAGQAICRDIGRESVAATRTARRGDVAGALRHALATSESYYRRFARLKPPSPRARAQIRRLLALERGDDRLWRRVVARLELGVPARQAVIAGVREGRQNRRRIDRLLRELGFVGCTTSELENWARRGL